MAEVVDRACYDLPTLMRLHADMRREITTAVAGGGPPQSQKDAALVQAVELQIVRLARSYKFESSILASSVTSLELLEQQWIEVRRQLADLAGQATQETIDLLRGQERQKQVESEYIMRRLVEQLTTPGGVPLQAEMGLVQARIDADAKVLSDQRRAISEYAMERLRQTQQRVTAQQATIAERPQETSMGQQQETIVQKQQDVIVIPGPPNGPPPESATGPQMAPSDSPMAQAIGGIASATRERVTEIRGENQAMMKPDKADKIAQQEQEQLVLHFEWETFSMMMQEQTRMTGEGGQLKCSAVANLDDSGALQVNAVEGQNVLLVLHQKQLPTLKGLERMLLQTWKCDRIDVLIQVDGDEGLFPLAPDIQGAIPWKTHAIRKLSRAVEMEAGQPLWFVVAQSSARSRSQGIQPAYQTVRMLPRGEAIRALTVKVPEPPANLHAVQVSNPLLTATMKAMGKKGAEWHSVPGRTPGSARVVFHQMEQEERDDLEKELMDTPWFACMPIKTYDGSDLKEASLVAQCFPRRENADRLAPYMWATARKASLQFLPGERAKVQVMGKAKLRIGIDSQDDADLWLREVLPRLISEGYLVKDERTDRFLGEEGAVLSDDSASDGGGDGSEAIIYDVPSWILPEGVLDILKSAGFHARSIMNAPWTPGDMSLRAWRVTGAGMAGAAGTMLRDPSSGATMYIISQRQYVAEKKAQQEASKRRREGATRRSQNRGQRPSYAAVLGKGGKGGWDKEEGRGGGRGQR